MEEDGKVGGMELEEEETVVEVTQGDTMPCEG